MYQKLRNDMNDQDKQLYEDEPSVIASPNSPMVILLQEFILLLKKLIRTLFLAHSLALFQN